MSGTLNSIEIFSAHPWKKIEATIKPRGKKLSILFSPFTPPTDPGVYVVTYKDHKPFYIGETQNLNERLRAVFRCLKCANPHICHKHYKLAFSSFPLPQDFCSKYCAFYLSTKGMHGRLEIEAHLQKKYSTNKKAFYKSLASKSISSM